MDKKTKAAPKIAEIAGKIVGLLEPLSSEDRLKVINGALTLLGETPTVKAPGAAHAPGQGPLDGGAAPDQSVDGLSPKAKSWMKQNTLTMAQVEHVFDITSGGVTVIASEVPGGNSKEQTHNAYVLQGISRLLASGDASFDDKDARKVCEDLGCYNKGNHAAYMSDKGNLLAGSKGTGWKLTAPGLKRGADLIKQITKREE